MLHSIHGFLRFIAEMETEMEIADKLIQTHFLTKEEALELLAHAGNKEMAARLAQEAVKLRQSYYGNKVFIRGLIEFTNHCKNNCYYCGIRRGNGKVKRYRLTEDEILECCDSGYELGFRTFVLQGGEDPYYTDERMTALVKRIKETYPDCALTLSVGEKSRASYAQLRKAGADRYLLRHETADEKHYGILHPKEMSLAARKQCLYDLKELGYQVGAGFMVGSPGQTRESLAEDLVFLQELGPQMVGIGPFVPHHETRFAGEPAGSVELTLFLLSVLRILLPKALLPATTALGTMDSDGREKGLAAGANVIMPNLSPMKNRKQYDLYDNKISTGEEAAECLDSLKRRVATAGYRLVCERGDFAGEQFSGRT